MKRIWRKILYAFIIFALLCVFFYCGWQLFLYFSESADTQGDYDQLSQIVQQAKPTEDPTTPSFDWSSLERLPAEEIIALPESPYVTVTDPESGDVTVLLPEFAELYLLNPDLVGWITIPGTRIDYPVVQRKDASDYYLKRDFYGNWASRGCIYVREACDVFTPSDNVTIYGHMMKDGTMFADLAQYTSKGYWQEHQYLQFNTLRARHTYQIICVFKTTATQGEGFSYHQFVDAQYDSDLDAFWQSCRENAFYDTGLDVTYGDKLICLSTCEYTLTNGRLVVVAKRID